MRDYTFLILRPEGQALMEIAVCIALGDSARHAMDRAAMGLNGTPELCPDLLVFGSEAPLPAVHTPFGDLGPFHPETIQHGDILVGEGTTVRVIGPREAAASDFRGDAVILR